MFVSCRYLIYIFVIANIVPYVFSIKCWTCRSNTDPKCADPFDNSTVPITDCKQEKGLSHLPGVRPTMCRKIRQKVDGQWIIYRSCAWVNDVDPSYTCSTNSDGTNEVVSSCETCDYDGCNGAATIGKTIALLTAPLVLFLFK